jgi:hypothetical protein
VVRPLVQPPALQKKKKKDQFQEFGYGYHFEVIFQLSIVLLTHIDLVIPHSRSSLNSHLLSRPSHKGI